jgi:hypothetical protein
MYKSKSDKKAQSVKPQSQTTVVSTPAQMQARNNHNQDSQEGDDARSLLTQSTASLTFISLEGSIVRPRSQSDAPMSTTVTRKPTTRNCRYCLKNDRPTSPAVATLSYV